MSDVSEAQRVLITVSGADTPGITSALTRVVAQAGARLLDIEQVVVQGQLILALLVMVDAGASRDEPVLKELLYTAHAMGLELRFTTLDDPEGGKVGEPHRYAITAIGDGLDAGGVHAISEVLATRSGNIETIRQLSDDQFSCIEVVLSLPGDPDGGASLRRALLDATADRDIDLALQPESLIRRSKRLVVMDMDSTLIRIEVIDELARMAGVVDKVATITERAMAGELDFEASLRERVALLKGLELEKVEKLAADLPLTEGASELLQVLATLGFKTGVISGGFTVAANALRATLGLDYAYANKLDVEGGVLTGQVLDPVVTPQRKADLLDTIAQSEGIYLDQVIAVGDGANDLPMLERAGLGIAFHAKPKLKAAADTALSQGGLDRILYLLGLHARDVNAILRRA